MNEVKSCPFCGSAAEMINDDTTTYGFKTPNWAIRCTMEDCIAYDIEPRYTEYESAIDDWNCRAADIAKPVKFEKTIVGDFRCPTCDVAFIEGMGETNYCGNCGQKLLREGKDE